VKVVLTRNKSYIGIQAFDGDRLFFEENIIGEPNNDTFLYEKKLRLEPRWETAIFEHLENNPVEADVSDFALS